MSIDEGKVREFIEKDHKILISYVAFAPTTDHPAPPVKDLRNNPEVFNAFKWLYDNNSPETFKFLEEVRVRVNQPDITDEQVLALIQQGLEALSPIDEIAHGEPGEAGSSDHHNAHGQEIFQFHGLAPQKDRPPSQQTSDPGNDERRTEVHSNRMALNVVFDLHRPFSVLAAAASRASSPSGRRRKKAQKSGAPAADRAAAIKKGLR